MGLANGIAVLEKERVIAMDARAREAGVRMGMRRGGVLTLAPAIVMHERDCAGEVNTVREVATGVLNALCSSTRQRACRSLGWHPLVAPHGAPSRGCYRHDRDRQRCTNGTGGMVARARSRRGGAVARFSPPHAGPIAGGPAATRASLYGMAHWHQLRNGRTTDATTARRSEEALRDSTARSARPRRWRCTGSV